jgi:hypothetical protein
MELMSWLTIRCFFIILFYKLYETYVILFIYLFTWSHELFCLNGLNQHVCIFPWINWYIYFVALLLQYCWLKMESSCFQQRGLEEPHAQNMLSLWMLITFRDQVAHILANWGKRRFKACLFFSSDNIHKCTRRKNRHSEMC